MRSDVETTLRMAAERLVEDIGDPDVFLILAPDKDGVVWISSNSSLNELKMFINGLLDEYPYFSKIVDIVELEREIESEVTMGEWR